MEALRIVHANDERVHENVSSSMIELVSVWLKDINRSYQRTQTKPAEL